MLSQFLINRDRSGKYSMKSHVYARAAFPITKYLFEPKCPGKLYEYKLPSEWQWHRQEYDDKIFRERKAKETSQTGLQYLPFFLTEAAPPAALVLYLAANQLDPIRGKALPRDAWAVDKANIEEEVTAYLQKCKGDGDVAMQS